VVKETTLIEEIQQNSTKEQEVIQELAKKDSQSWEDNSIVYVEGRIHSKQQENHDPVNIRHPGQQRMLKLIKKNYLWPEIKNDVKNYV